MVTDNRLNSIEVIVVGQHLLNTLGQIRTLGESGIHPTVIWMEYNSSHNPQKCKYIGNYYSVRDSLEAFDLIVSKRNFDNKAIISSDSDSFISLLDKHYSLLKDYYFFFNAGKDERLSAFLSKVEQCTLAESVGFNVPKTEQVNVGELPRRVSYPIFTKSIDSFDPYWKKDTSICMDENDLLDFYKSCSSSSVLLQSFIEKDNEIALEGVSLDSGNTVIIPVQGEYLRCPKDGFGSYKKLESYSLGEEILVRVKKMLQHIGYSGIFEIEFMRDKSGKLFFLEINFRHTQYNHALTDMGANLMMDWIRSITMRRFAPTQILKSPLIVINEIKDFRTYVLTKQISLFKWLKDFVTSDSYYLWDQKDYFFVFAYFLRALKTRLTLFPSFFGLGRR
ncbi:MAG: ATP-grasp domain-containing protein [Bacteroidales bacterium]|nr:ATP-grasp domain-containing protein [Bacteroidales bacterium]